MLLSLHRVSVLGLFLSLALCAFAQQDETGTNHVNIGHDLGSHSGNIRKRRLFDVDATILNTFFGTLNGLQGFSLGTFSLDDTAGTTQIYRYFENLIPTGANLTCFMNANTLVGTGQLQIKFGSNFESLNEGTIGVVADSSNVQVEVVYTGPNFGTAYVMASTDGFIDGNLQCRSPQIVNTDGGINVYFGSVFNNLFSLQTYGINNDVSGTTQQYELWGDTFITGFDDFRTLPAFTAVTCEVTCDFGGQGVAEIKFGTPFASPGQGVAVTGAADRRCPFSVTATTTEDQKGFLLVYSQTGSLINAEATCTTSTLPPTLSPTFDLGPTPVAPTPTPAVPTPVVPTPAVPTPTNSMPTDPWPTMPTDPWPAPTMPTDPWPAPTDPWPTSTPGFRETFFDMVMHIVKFLEG